MRICPISIREANEYVAKWHRHNRPVRIARFAVAVRDESKICGVAIVTLPTARLLMDGQTAEIARVATDGTLNACSMLYGACRRAAFALGFSRVITYTLHSESGASLRGAGFFLVKTDAGGKSWHYREGRSFQNVCMEIKNRDSIFSSRKDAKKYCEKKNRRSTTYRYMVWSVREVDAKKEVAK